MRLRLEQMKTTRVVEEFNVCPFYPFSLVLFLLVFEDMLQKNNERIQLIIITLECQEVNVFVITHHTTCGAQNLQD